MKQKQILVILIVAIIAILLCVTTYMLVNSNQGDFTTLRLSDTCTIDVLNTNHSLERLNGGVSKFSYNKDNLTVTHQKSTNNSEIKSMYNNQIKNSKNIEDNIYYDDSTGVYSVFVENKNTGDSILITSTNLDLLKQVSGSVHFKKSSNTNTTTNTTDNSTSDTSADSNSQTTNYQSQRSSSNNQSNSNSNNNNNQNTPSEDTNDEPQQDESKYPSFIPF